MSFDERNGSLFVFVSDPCTGELFGHKPDLQFVPAQDVADQQVVGSIVAIRRRGMRGLACNKRNN